MANESPFHCAPVLMIGFNRPELMHGLLDRVRKARPAQLFFAVDGPRENTPEDAASVAAVQALSNEVDWPCEVKTLFRKKNLGCALGVSGAITWALEQVPQCIILEDDCWPTEGFFRYVSELLEKYQDDDRVGMVSGFNHYGFQTDTSASYHFTTHADIWGWGTWARVWKHYALDISGMLPRLGEILRKSCQTNRMRRMLTVYTNCVLSQPSTWDIQFALMVADKGYLCAAPRKRMVLNKGFCDKRGMHTQGYCYDAVHYSDVWGGDESLRHPMAVEPDFAAIRKTERRMCGIVPRSLTYLGASVSCLSELLTAIGCAVEHVAPWLFRL